MISNSFLKTVDPEEALRRGREEAANKFYRQAHADADQRLLDMDEVGRRTEENLTSHTETLANLKAMQKTVIIDALKSSPAWLAAGLISGAVGAVRGAVVGAYSVIDDSNGDDSLVAAIANSNFSLVLTPITMPIAAVVGAVTGAVDWAKKGGYATMKFLTPKDSIDYPEHRHQLKGMEKTNLSLQGDKTALDEKVALVRPALSERREQLAQIIAGDATPSLKAAFTPELQAEISKHSIFTDPRLSSSQHLVLS